MVPLLLLLRLLMSVAVVFVVAAATVDVPEAQERIAALKRRNNAQPTAICTTSHIWWTQAQTYGGGSEGRVVDDRGDWRIKIIS